MFEALLDASGRLGGTGSHSDRSDELAKYLPSKYSFEDILREIARPDEEGDTKSLRALQLCLSNSQLEHESESDQEAIYKIAEYVARSILPIAPNSNDAVAAWKKIAIKGTVGVGILRVLRDDYKATLDPKVLLAVAAYVNERDSWASTASAKPAKAILDDQLSDHNAKETFIISTVLSTFLRPLFSKARPATVTASGRKAEFIEPVRYAGSFNEPSEVELKPWKHGQRYAITVFEWAVLNSDHEILAKHWHLYTPVLLTLLDEPQTEIKVRAIQIFSVFWARCPPGQMAKVGLADVFEQAIFPAVLYLPTLTPEDESIQILDVAYPALFQIAGLSYPEESIGEPVKQPAFTDSQGKLLDKIIRQGILVGHHHANEHIRLTELFCNKATSIVNGMGILAVKHLKDLIPIISAIMVEPFGTKYPPTLLAANRLVQAILRCCWPRIGSYTNEIIRVLTVCFLNIEDEDDFRKDQGSRDDLHAALMQTAEILSAVMKSHNTSLLDVVSPLVEKEPVLKTLFVPTKIYSNDTRTDRPLRT